MIRWLWQWFRSPVREAAAELSVEVLPPAEPEPRDDALNEAISSAFRRGRVAGEADAVGVMNLASKLGVEGSDRTVSATPSKRRQFWEDDQMQVAMAHGGMYRRLVDAPPADATRSGFRVDEGEDRDVLPRKEMKRLRRVAVKARQKGRGFRGCWAWMVTDDGLELSEPLPDRPLNITAYHLFAPAEVTTVKRHEDARVQDWLRPEVVRVTPRRSGRVAGTSAAFRFAGQEIHTSRMVYVPGLPLPDHMTRPQLDADASVLDVYWPSLRRLGTALQSTENLMYETSVPVMKLAKRDSTMGGSAREAAINGVRMLRGMISNLGVMLIGPSDSYERSTASLAGWRESIITAYEGVCSVEGFVLTKLLGMPPAGMTSDDKSGEATYHELLETERDDYLEPILERILDVLRGPNEARRIVWPDLKAPTRKEVAETSLIYAQRDAALITAMAITPEESRSRFEGDEEVEMPSLEAFEYPEMEDQAEEVEPADVKGDPAGQAAATAETAAVALNGTQMTSAGAIVEKVATKKLLREDGVAQLMEFLGVDKDRAERIMGANGRSFFIAEEGSGVEA